MIYVVGTYHELQHSARPVRAISRGVDVARVENARDSLKFQLKEIAARAQPKLIAEEFSLYVLEALELAFNMQVESNVKAVADELGIEHRYCDPDPRQREELGLPCHGTEHIEDEQRLRFHKLREKFWLNELRDATDDDILFVCGPEHVNSFQCLLLKKRIPSKIEIEDFGKDIYGT